MNGKGEPHGKGRYHWKKSDNKYVGQFCDGKVSCRVVRALPAGT